MASSKFGYRNEAEVALGAARDAARLCRAVQKERVAGLTLTKGDKSPVTIADFGSQAVVSRHLLLAFPSDPLMGEEQSSELREPKNGPLADEVCARVAALVPSARRDEVLAWIDRANFAGGRERFWALDPIDGTKGFLRGEQYAVALALLEGGEVKVAALACPNLPFGSEPGCVLVAVRGSGTTIHSLEAGEGARVQASPLDDPRSARIVESVEAAHGDLGRNERIRARLGVTAPSVRLDSQAKYAVLARGDAEVYLRMPSSNDYRENLWDQAAGALVITEAGGRVTDVDGRPLDFTTGRKLTANRGVVATNGRLHERVLAAVAAERG